MSLIGKVHARAVFGRRVRVLAEMLTALVPEGPLSLLDVGCGDGLITSRIAAARTDLTAEGIDVFVRPQTHIPVTAFDGHTLPFADRSIDVVQFVDVLHHTDDPMILLREAVRVARRAILIKDHCRDGFLAGPTLRFMDWVGNAPHGVRLPYNYWPEARWRQAFAELGTPIEEWIRRVPLYPWPASMLFQRGLHFIARLGVSVPSGVREA